LICAGETVLYVEILYASTFGQSAVAGTVPVVGSMAVSEVPVRAFVAVETLGTSGCSARALIAISTPAQNPRGFKRSSVLPLVVDTIKCLLLWPDRALSILNRWGCRPA
jgi:hypothetical protein